MHFRILQIHYELVRDSQYRLHKSLVSEENKQRVQIEMFHEQLPLPVPCYDLLPVTDLTVGHPRMDFGYYQLP